MRIVAFMTKQDAIDQILNHLRSKPSRAPPRHTVRAGGGVAPVFASPQPGLSLTSSSPGARWGLCSCDMVPMMRIVHVTEQGATDKVAHCCLIPFRQAAC
jgi:hypothetical protein